VRRQVQRFLWGSRRRAPADATDILERGRIGSCAATEGVLRYSSSGAVAYVPAFSATIALSVVAAKKENLGCRLVKQPDVTQNKSA
jgi:hypothetical protein